jgi:S1-C subfamily serine protease
MTPDFAVDLINATVQLEQPAGDGLKTVGTGFLVSAPRPDGSPRTVLVSAAHVFRNMPQDEVAVGWRRRERGVWRYSPEPLTIRVGGVQRWAAHPAQDVAVMEIAAPPEFARAAIPLAWLAEEDTFDRWRLRPADEMLSLGFPRGLSANRAGFPILRSARLASYPLSPVSEFPMFLLDFRVFPGNSGGPVFIERPPREAEGLPVPRRGFVAGVLSKQVEVKAERLEIGVVVHAKFVREAIALLDAPPGAAAAAGASPAAAQTRD